MTKTRPIPLPVAAVLVPMSLERLLAAIHAGSLCAVEIGGEVMVMPDSLRRFVADHGRSQKSPSAGDRPIDLSPTEHLRRLRGRVALAARALTLTRDL